MTFEGIRCPECGSMRNHVTDSRPSHKSVRRRRECLRCGSRFTTYELAGGDIPVSQEERSIRVDHARLLSDMLVSVLEKDKRSIRIDHVRALAGRLHVALNHVGAAHD